MKKYEDPYTIYRVSSLRAGIVVLSCVVLYLVCIGCRSSRSVSQISTTERHEVFSNATEVDSLDLSGSVAEIDSTSINITEKGFDTIKIERDSAGRPTLIIWNHYADYLGLFGSSRFSDIGFTNFHTSGRNESTGAVDDFDQKEEESKTEIDTSLPLAHIIGCSIVLILVLYYLGDWFYNSWKRQKK